MIRSGLINYEIGDEVVLLKRKNTGYPAQVEDDVIYTIKEIENDHILISKSLVGLRWSQPIKVHKTYLINKSKLRDIKINSILNETNRL